MAKKASASSGESVPMGPLVRIALFKGPDAFLRGAFTDELRKAIEATGVPVDVLRFDGSNAQVADVLDECRSMGLMAQHKLVVVDRAEVFVRESGDEVEAPPPPPTGGKGKGRGRAGPSLTRRQMLEAYAKSPCEGATLVLRAETWRPGNLDKLIPAVGVIKECEAPTPERAVAALIRRARDTEKRELTPEAAALLVERIGPELGLLVHELEKLSLLTPEGAKIEPELVREMVGMSREDEAWDLQPALLGGSAAEACGTVRELLEVSRVPEVMMRFAAIDLAKKAHGYSRGLAQGTPPGVLMRSYWIKGQSLQEAVMGAAKRVPAREWARLMARGIEIDARAKTGRCDHEEIEIEALAIEFSRVVG